MTAKAEVDCATLSGGEIDGVLHQPSDRAPIGLLVAIHGGGFDHRYFNVPGHSTVESMTKAGFAALSINRPGYGKSPTLSSKRPIRDSVAPISDVIARLAHEFELNSKVILLGHSIGGAVALSIAATAPTWLAGVTVTGIGDEPPFSLRLIWRFLPREGKVARGSPRLQRRYFFGASSSFDSSIPEMIGAISCSAPSSEAIEVLSKWPKLMPLIASRIIVPVQFGLADRERTWKTGPKVLDRMASYFIRAPRVEAILMENGSHLFEFHRSGSSLIDRQRSFARRCIEAANEHSPQTANLHRSERNDTSQLLEDQKC